MKIPTRNETTESRAARKPTAGVRAPKGAGTPRTGVKPKERPASKGRVHKGRTRD